MKRSSGIIAYGTPEDRARLEQLARLRKVSASTWIIKQIREQHAVAFSQEATDVRS